MCRLPGMYLLTGVAVRFLYGEGGGAMGGSTLSSHWAYVWSSLGGRVASSNIPLGQNETCTRMHNQPAMESTHIYIYLLPFITEKWII